MGTLLSRKKSNNAPETVSNGAAAPAEAEAKEEAPAETPKEEEAKPAEEAAKTEEQPAKTEEAPPAAEESQETPAADSQLTEDEAAVKIQAIVRGKKAREEVKAMKEGETPAETPAETSAETPAETTETPAEAEAEKPAEGVEESNPEEEEAAAIKIQASFRGMKARKEVEALKDSKTEGSEDTPAEPEAASGGETTTDTAEN